MDDSSRMDFAATEAPRAGAAVSKRPNPYVGPRPFGERDQNNFFGRDDEARQLTGLIIAHRAVLFYAQSGAGKTSLLRAKVIPALRDGADTTVLLVRRMTGGETPDLAPQDGANIYVSNVLQALNAAQPDRPAPVATTLADGLRPLLASLATSETGAPAPALLVFDQFEEFFTSYGERQAERADFFRQVQECLAEYGQLSLLFSMREDYIAELDSYRAQLPDRLRTRFRLERLTAESALAATCGPAARAGCPFAPGVAEDLVDNLRRIQVGRRRSDGAAGGSELGPYVEPVHLQLVCHQLWENLPPDRAAIQSDDVQSFGNVDDALTGFFRASLAQALRATSVSERHLRDWFQDRLITPAKTRALVYRGAGETGGLPNAAVDVLDNAYIIRANARGNDTWYELTHDRLIAPIQADNAAWFAEHLNTFQRQAEVWENNNRSKDLLLRGAALTEAERWADERSAELLEYERAFLQACLDARAIAEREQRQARRIRWLAAGATGLAIVAVLLFLFAANRWQVADNAHRSAVTAEAQVAAQLVKRETLEAEARESASRARVSEAQALASKNEAVNAKATAEQGQRLAEEQSRIALSRQAAAVASWLLDRGDGRQAVLLDIGAYQVAQTSEAEEGLRDALRTWRERAVLEPQPKARISGGGFSPDGQLAATIAGNVLYLWELDGQRRVLALRGHKLPLTDARISPNGLYVATTSEDGTARLWELRTGRQILSVPFAKKAITTDFSPDSKRVAFGAEDGIIVVWQVDPLQQVQTLTHESWGFPVRIAFSPDGKLLAGAFTDNVARVWFSTMRVTLGENDTGHQGVVWDVKFSPDGAQLVTVGQDNTIRVWNPQTGEQLGMTDDTTELEGGIVYSPDGRFVAAGSRTGAIYLWDVTRPLERPAILPGHSQAVSAVDISPDGRHVASASFDGTARLWNVGSRTLEAVLAGHASRLLKINYSADGRYLLTTSDDGTARVWDPHVDSGGEIALMRHEAPLLLAGATEDGRRVVSAGERVFYVWNPETGSEEAYPTGADVVRAAALSPDGSAVAIADGNGNVTLWDAGSGEQKQILLERDDAQLTALAFHPTEPLLAVAADDGVVRVLDTGAGTEWILKSVASDANAVTFAPEGEMLAVGHADGAVRLWQWRAGAEERVLRGGGAVPLSAIAFGGGGARMHAAYRDGRIVTWDLARADDEPIATAHGDGPARSLAVHGSVIATGDESGLVTLRDGRGAVRLTGHERWVEGVAFTQNGERLVSAGQDGTVRVWPATPESALALACQGIGAGLTGSDWASTMRRYAERPPEVPICSGTPARRWTESTMLPPPGQPIAAGSGLRRAGPPIIYYFEAAPGTQAKTGESVTLRWDLGGAQRAFMYPDKANGVVAPDQFTVTPNETTVYRLVAENQAGTTERWLKVTVRP